MRIAHRHFIQLEEEPKNRFGQSSAVTSPLSRGLLREYFVEEVLRRHLPSRIQIARNAQIFDRFDHQCQEQDLVLYRDDFPKIAIGLAAELLMADSVIATVQVKSKLTFREFTKDMEKVESVRRLSRRYSSNGTYDDYKDRIKCYLVAYNGPRLNTLDQWVTRYFQGNDELIKSRCYDAAWIVNRGLHLLDDGFVWPERDGDFLCGEFEGSLGWLVTHMVFTASRHPSVFANIGDYFNPL